MSHRFNYPHNSTQVQDEPFPPSVSHLQTNPTVFNELAGGDGTASVGSMGDSNMMRPSPDARGGAGEASLRTNRASQHARSGTHVCRYLEAELIALRSTIAALLSRISALEELAQAGPSFFQSTSPIASVNTILPLLPQDIEQDTAILLSVENHGSSFTDYASQPSDATPQPARAATYNGHSIVEDPLRYRQASTVYATNSIDYAIQEYFDLEAAALNLAESEIRAGSLPETVLDFNPFPDLMQTVYIATVATPTVPTAPSASIQHFCRHCSRGFARAYELNRHAVRHDPNGLRHSCPFPGCDRVGRNGFRRKDNLKQHQNHKGH